MAIAGPLLQNKVRKLVGHLFTVGTLLQNIITLPIKENVSKFY